MTKPYVGTLATLCYLLYYLSVPAGIFAVVFGLSTYVDPTSISEVQSTTGTCVHGQASFPETMPLHIFVTTVPHRD